MPVRPISTLKGRWNRLLDDERLRRSSQVLSVVEQTVCIFGGEVQPRQPVDDKIDVFSLKPGIIAPAQHGSKLNLTQVLRILTPSRPLQHQVLVLEAHLL